MFVVFGRLYYLSNKEIMINQFLINFNKRKPTYDLFL